MKPVVLNDCFLYVRFYIPIVPIRLNEMFLPGCCDVALVNLIIERRVHGSRVDGRKQYGAVASLVIADAIFDAVVDDVITASNNCVVMATVGRLMATPLVV